MSYTLTKNSSIDINLREAFADQGWIVSNGIAYHDGCNPGEIKRLINFEAIGLYTFEFEVGTVTSGTIKVIAGTLSSPEINVAGIYKYDLQVTNLSTIVKFYSTGKNNVKVLKIYPVTEESNGKTLVFNEDENRFGGDHSYRPELYVKYIDSLFVFKNGELWEQGVNPIYNNFFGVQYTSQIQFVANADKELNKLWFQIKIDSNGRWSAPEMITEPNETHPNGMKTMLHENNFDLDNGQYWADIRKDMLDPNFDTQLQALFEGRTIEGPILITKLETKETKEIKLRGVFLYSSPQDRNF